MTVIPAAPDIAEDVILPALRRLGPAWWGVAPEGTAGDLLRPASDPLHLRRVFVAQHQDGGGQSAPHLRSAGWSGLVTVRCLSAEDADARDGRDRAHTAMLGMASPAGYGLRARLAGWVPPGRDRDGIYVRGTVYEVTLRRAA